jgi:hypothetical protein
MIRWLICLFRGHKKWIPSDANVNTWDLVNMKDVDGSGVNVNVCKCCGKIFSKRFNAEKKKKENKRRCKIEIWLNKYNHTMEMLRTLLAILAIILQLIILSKVL